MKILHTSDFHLGKTLDGRSREYEQREFLSFFEKKSKSIKPDLIIISGDIFDSPNPPAISQAMFYDCINQISNSTDSLIIIIPGNHDNPVRLSSARQMAYSHGVIIYQTHYDDIKTGKYKNSEILSCNDGVIKVKINSEIVNIMAIPYLNESRLNEGIQNLFDSEEKKSLSFQDKLKKIIDEKEKYFDEDEINIMVAHLFAVKDNLSKDDIIQTLGGSYIVDTSIFPKSANYIALGHIHKKQVLGGTDKKAYYPGSPIHYNKTEAKSQNKVMLEVDIDDEKNLTINEIEIPVFKKIEIWKTDSVDEAIRLSEEKKDENSFVYIEIKTDTFIDNDKINTILNNKKDVIEIKPILTGEVKQIKVENMLEKSEKDKFIEFYKQQNGYSPSENIVNRYMDIIKQQE